MSDKTGLSPIVDLILLVLVPLGVGTILILFGRLFKALVRSFIVNRKKKVDLFNELKTLYLKPKTRINQQRKFSSFSVRTYMASSQFGVVWLMLQLLLTVTSVTLYVVELYMPEHIPTWMEILEFVVAAVFTVDYLLAFYGAEDKLRHFWHFATVVDLVTILPVFFTFMFQGLSVYDQDVIRLLRCLRIIRLSRALQFTRSTVNRQAIIVIITIVSLFFISASVFRIVENLPFHDSFYYITATFTSVGYGDIYPESPEGKILMTFLIIIGFFVVTYETGKLVSAIQKSPAYAGEFRIFKEKKHVIMLGTITDAALHEFFREFFHKKHNAHIKIVFLGKSKPSFELIQLLTIPFYQQNVEYFMGSEIEVETLERIKLNKAAHCFILGNKFADDPDQADLDTIIRCLAVASHNQSLPQTVQLIKSENDDHLPIFANVQVLGIEQTVMSLLARTTFVPGFNTLISNLVRTHMFESSKYSGWRSEYAYGCANQIYGGALPLSLCGVSFQEAAVEIYKQFNVILFAVVHTSNKNHTEVNPTDFTVEMGDIGFMISPSENLVDDISKFKFQRSAFTPTREDTSNSATSTDNFMMKPLKNLKGQMKTLTTQVKDYSDTFKDILMTDLISLDDQFEEQKDDTQSYDFTTILESSERSEWHDYFYLQDPDTSNFDEKILSKVDFTDHIIVCGPLGGLFSFLLPLRSKRLKAIRTVVIMYHEEPDQFTWNRTVGMFPDVYFISGSTLLDLSSAGADKAKMCILLCDPSQMKNSIFEDAPSVITMRAVQSRYRNLTVVSEIAHISSSQFLQDNDSQAKKRKNWFQQLTETEDQDSNSLFDDSFASGKVFPSTLLIDSLLCQSFYYPYLIPIIQLLVVGEGPNFKGMVSIFFVNSLTASSLVYQIDLPDNFDGTQFVALFEYLLTEKQILAIGLYRQNETHGHYALCNPTQQTVLKKSDKIYVLAEKDPASEK